jgi:hypothetical protein
MLIYYDASLQFHYNPVDQSVTVVGNENIHIYACPTDPGLSMNPSCQLNLLGIPSTLQEYFVGDSQRIRKGDERLFSCVTSV